VYQITGAVTLEKIQKFFIEVLQINPKQDQIYKVDPLSKIIYKDKYKDNLITLNSTTVINRNISNLEISKWYMWIVLPGKTASGTDELFPSDNPLYYRKNVLLNTLNSTEIANNVYIDLRGFQICKWTGIFGCEFIHH